VVLDVIVNAARACDCFHPGRRRPRSPHVTSSSSQLSTRNDDSDISFKLSIVSYIQISFNAYFLQKPPGLSLFTPVP